MPASAADEEDDYLNMSFAEPVEQKHETSFQRRERKKREAEEKARPKSKAVLKAEADAARELALATALDSSNKGFKMMAKMGFKGGALGTGESAARMEPIEVSMKEDRSGIGLENEKKRKFRNAAEKAEIDTKKAKVDEGDYRERMRLEREQKRLEGQIIGAMKVAERLDEGQQVTADSTSDQAQGVEENAEPEQKTTEQPPSADDEQLDQPLPPKVVPKRPYSSINVLWRGLVRHRLMKERERRMRYDLHQSLSRLPTYNDPDEDEQYKQALGKEEEEIEEEDTELDEFAALEPAERLAKLLDYLRTKYHYCFWCKFQYHDETMEDDGAKCPGLTEDDHD